MADQKTASNAKKRHKPIEPPSPEPRHLISSEQQVHRSGHHQQPSSPREHKLPAASRYQEQTYRHRSDDQQQHDDGDNLMQQQRKVRASVFERLGESGVTQAKRPNPCLNWLNTGSCPRGRNCIYIHPPLSPEKLPISNAAPYQRQYQPQRGHQQSVRAVHHKPLPIDRQRRQHDWDYRCLAAGNSEEGGGDQPTGPETKCNVDARTLENDGHKRQQKRRDDAGHLLRGPQNFVQGRHRTGHAAYASSTGSAENVELLEQDNAKLRSKVVMTKTKTEEPKRGEKGRSGNSVRHTDIPPESDLEGDGQELESEEALKRQLKELKRQLKELDEGEECDDGLLVDLDHAGKAAKRHLETMEANSRGQKSRNGVVAAVKRARYQHRSASPASSVTTFGSSGWRGGPSRADPRRDEMLSVDGEDDKGRYHRDHPSVRSHESSSRRVESPIQNRNSRRVNGERFPHSVGDWRGNERRRSPSAETSSSKRSHRDSRDVHHASAMASTHAVSSASSRWQQRRFPRAQPSPQRHGRHGHEHTDGGFRPVAMLHEGRPRALRAPDQNHDQKRRLPDRFYDRNDDRGNHSKTRTSMSWVPTAHPPSGSLATRYSPRRPDAMAGNVPSMEDGHRRTERTGRLPAPPFHSRVNQVAFPMKKTRVDDRRKRPLPTPEKAKSGRAMSTKRAKYNSKDHQGGQSSTEKAEGSRQLGEKGTTSADRHRAKEHSSQSSTNKAPAGSSKPNDSSKPETDGARPSGELSAMEQHELEPISDEEVEEMSGELLLGADREEPEEPSPADAQDSKVMDALNVEWAEVMRAGGSVPSRPSQRRRCFDLDYFASTLSLCDEYGHSEHPSTAAGETSNSHLLSRLCSRHRPAISARFDLRMRRQLCGLTAEVGVHSSAVELNVPMRGPAFRKALLSFDKWTNNGEGQAPLQGGSPDGAEEVLRTTL